MSTSSKVYCLRRTISGTFLSVHANRSKPAIIAFKSLNNARNIKHFHSQLEKPRQEVVIATYTKESLVAMCQNAYLDIEILDDDITITLEADPRARLELLTRAYTML